MARNNGVVDTKNFPRNRPTGTVKAMSIAAPLETGADISQTFGADKPNPPRGSKPPPKGPHRPR
jgi:hypothetical protein